MRYFGPGFLVRSLSLGACFLLACAPAAPPTPTSPPAKPALTAEPVARTAPTAAPTAAPKEIDYPRQPITLIVPWAAGGDTDVPMRVVAEFVAKELGQPIVVQNVVGASGSTGTRQARAARPDGYTLLSIHEHVIINQGTGVTDYGPLDFEPIALIVTSPDFLVTEASNPWSSLKELIDDAKKRPGEISWGMTFGSTTQMFAFAFMHKTGTKFRPVSYEGTAQRITALLGKQIDLASSPLSTAVQHVSANRMRVLGYAWDDRDPRLPNASTLREQGVDLVFGTSRGWVAPKGTPIEIVKKVEAAIQRAVQNPELKKKIEDEQGSLLTFLPREQYIEKLRQQDVELRKIIQETGMTAS